MNLNVDTAANFDIYTQQMIFVSNTGNKLF